MSLTKIEREQIKISAKLGTLEALAQYDTKHKTEEHDSLWKKVDSLNIRVWIGVGIMLASAAFMSTVVIIKF